MPYDKSVPEVQLRVRVKGDALRGLYRARDMLNVLYFMGQRRMTCSATIHILVELLEERWRVDQDALDEWLRGRCEELAPLLGRPVKEQEIPDEQA